MENQVVAGYLVENFLGYVYGWAFVFYYNFGLTSFVIDYRIASATHST